MQLLPFVNPFMYKNIWNFGEIFVWKERSPAANKQQGVIYSIKPRSIFHCRMRTALSRMRSGLMRPWFTASRTAW